MMTLKHLKVGYSARVAEVKGTGNTKRKLADMGITPDTQLTVVRMAPFGDPIEIKLRGYTLTLRKEDAKKIILADGSTTKAEKIG